MTQALAADVRRQGDAPTAETGTRVAMSAELQRLWKDVFDQSRVVPAGEAQPVSEAAPPRVGAAGPTRSPMTNASPAGAVTRGAAAQAEPAEAAGSSDAHAVRPAAAVQGGGVVAARAATAATPLVMQALATGPSTLADGRGSVASTAVPIDIATPIDGPAAPTVEPTSTAAPAAAARPRTSARPVETTEERTDETPDKTHPPALAAERGEAPPDEVIQVFQRDGALEIVIRDSALDPQAALRCALETARQLTGDTRSLRQLTLNGRAVLTRDGRDAPARPPHPLVSFSC